MKLITILFIYLSLCFLSTSCKDKCGCENDPEMIITDTEVLLREDSDNPIIKYELKIHQICNKSIIPHNLLDSLKKVGTAGIQIKVTAETFPYCKEGRLVNGPFMKIEKIEELVDKH